MEESILTSDKLVDLHFRIYQNQFEHEQMYNVDNALSVSLTSLSTIKLSVYI